MRIAWCTPFTRRPVGEVSRAVTDELARRCDVEIVHPPTSEPLPTNLTTHPLLGLDCDADTRLLSSFDVVVYCIGDDARAYRSIYEASQRVPGIVVLHDLVVHDLFAEMWLTIGDIASYLNAVESLYGLPARDIARREHESGSRWEWRPPYVAQMPMFELAVRGAWGVLTHSETGRRHVEQRFTGPVDALALPHVPSVVPAGVAPWRRGSANDRDARVTRVVTVAEKGARVDTVLHALAEARDVAATLDYVVFEWFDDWERETLRTLVAELGLEDVVALVRDPDEADVQATFAQADLCIDVRTSPEAWTPAVVEAMWHAKPVVVSDLGSAADIPDACVLKVDAANDAAGLASALRRVLADRDALRAVGLRAAEYAREHLLVERYAEGVVAFTDEVRRTRPYLAMNDDLARQLGRVGIEPGMSVISRVAATVEDLFGGALDDGAVR
ncbi:MAG TPA: glycosyltransferase family 4 protein [Acidimicrobiia bacterium]|nr:glycosyltransferase family 4 protein [Acidimicrobiia bacterium]